MATIKARIARGVALLDAEKPGWREKIDCETLDLKDGCNCVVGQIYGGYLRGLNRLHMGSGRVPIAHGFATSIADFGAPSYATNYRRLTTAWKRELDCEDNPHD